MPKLVAFQHLADVFRWTTESLPKFQQWPTRWWLVTPIYKPLGHLEGGTTLLKGLTITMVIWVVVSTIF